MFDLGWVEGLINVALLLGVVPILLVSTYRSNRRCSGVSLTTAKYLIPILLICSINVLPLFSKYVGRSDIHLSLIALVFLGIAIGFLIKSIKVKLYVLSGYLLVSLSIMSMNPEVLSFVYYEGKQSHPLDKTGVTVLYIDEWRRGRGNISRNYSKYTLKLSDGRVITANIENTVKRFVPAEGDLVLLEKRFFEHGIYTHNIIGVIKSIRNNDNAYINIPILRRPKFSSEKVELGYAKVVKTLTKTDLKKLKDNLSF